MNITKILVDEYDFSKYRIHKSVGVSWNTVLFWYKGVFKPKKRSQDKLEKIFNKAKRK